jgi:Cu+-exporting ATPase
MDEAEILRLAAALEDRSEHPLAAAVVAAARRRGIAPAPVDRFESIPGEGVSGHVEGRQVRLGNTHLMQRLGSDPLPSDLLSRAESLRRDGQTTILVSVDGRSVGILGVADPIRPSTPVAIDKLRRDGMMITMLTGDGRSTAATIARQLHLSEFEAELLPADKVAWVKRVRSAGRIVAMAGDGVNDAPALAAADVGIAMGSGTDVAMESAGITLMTGDLRALVRARRLSRATLRNIRQNLFFAFAYNTLCVPVAAGVLYPLTGALLSPMVAAAAMSVSSLTVIGNALRLRRLSLHDS